MFSTRELAASATGGMAAPDRRGTVLPVLPVLTAAPAGELARTPCCTEMAVT
ncbi:MAG TPA: hypothetical protein VH023_19325 [Rhodopila sp.]|jgi:hypothetical protein|nr:hypothetical protein [Rhodopila sp.]